LQSAVIIQGKAREISKFRAHSNKYSRLASRQQNLQRNLQILDCCSTFDHEKIWKQIRKIGNVTIFNESAEYGDWKARADSSALLYTGKPGSGKSVLLANIVDDLHLHGRGEDIPVAYFFCQHDIHESLEARTVVGAFARQLLRSIDLAPARGSFANPGLDQDFGRIFSLLQASCRPVLLEHTSSLMGLMDLNIQSEQP
jgi:hypothetical protein